MPTQEEFNRYILNKLSNRYSCSIHDQLVEITIDSDFVMFGLYNNKVYVGNRLFRDIRNDLNILPFSRMKPYIHNFMVNFFNYDSDVYLY